MPYTLFRILGILFSVLPPLVATLGYFPLWQTRGSETVLCGVTALLVVLCAIPLLRILIQKVRTPSATLLWTVLYALFFSLSRVADEMCVISFFGMIGALIGSVFFRLGAKGGSA